MRARILCIIIISFFLANKSIKAQTVLQPPYPVQQKTLANPNPTSYTFNIPSAILRDTIIKLFGTRQQLNDKILGKMFYFNWPETGDVRKHQVIFSPETSETVKWGLEYFETAGNINDIYLDQSLDYWYSTTYYHKTEPFKFTSTYGIKFTILDKDHTMVTIKSINTEILNGTLCCRAGGKYFKDQPVAATTVEEYALILYIAEKLGINDLKPLELPK